MTAKNKQEIKQDIKTGFTVANFFLILSIAFYTGFWKGNAEEVMQNNAKTANKAKEQIIVLENKMEEKFEKYVPRKEISSKLDMMINMMEEMKKDIKDNRK